MFTGLIEAICVVKATSTGLSPGTVKITVDLADLAEGAKKGDSIAINGVCLTIVQLQGTLASFEVSSETLSSSKIGSLKSGDKVNIERALRADGRFGGHFVLGHVDGTGKIKKIDKQQQFAVLSFAVESKLLYQIVPKGSIAIDGISLTVAELHPWGFTVAVIPETLDRTTLGTAKVNDKVNIETDVIVKAISKQLGRMFPDKQGLTIDKLREMGY